MSCSFDWDSERKRTWLLVLMKLKMAEGGLWESRLQEEKETGEGAREGVENKSVWLASQRVNLRCLRLIGYPTSRGAVSLNKD